LKNIRRFIDGGRHRPFIAGAFVALLACAAFFLLTRGAAEPEPLKVAKIDFERFVLANGLEVVVHRDAAAPIASVNVSYRVGSRDDPRGKSGLTHLTEHLMLSAPVGEGADAHQWAGRLGAWDYNGATDRDRTRLYMTVPRQALDAALWAESERMGRLSERLSDEAVELARQDVLNELRRNLSETGAGVESAVSELIFTPDHPYTRPPGGVAEDLARVTAEDVRQWLRERYRPNNATLVVAGDVDPAAVRARAEAYFGQIPGGRRSRQSVTWLPWHEPPSRHTTPALPPGAFVLAWALPGYGSPDLDLLDLARHDIEARLTRRLVRGERAARSVRLDLKPYQLCSLLLLTVEPNAEGGAADLLPSVERELEELGRDGPQPRGLNAARRHVLTSLLFTAERLGGAVGRAEILASGAVLTGDASEFNKTVERIQGASAGEVAAAAKTWLSPRAATLITSGPKAGQPAPPSAGEGRPAPLPPPADGWAPSYPVPEEMELPNGLTVRVLRRAGPVGAVKLVWPRDPSLAVRDELLTKAVLGLLPEVGAGRRASGAASDPALLSSELIVDNTPSYYAVGLSLPGQYLEGGLAALSEMVTGDGPDEARASAVRKQWAERLAGGEPSDWRPPLAALLRLAATGGLDEAQQPDCGDLTALTAADMKRTFEEQFRPDAATLLVVGDTSLGALGEKVTRLFGSWRSGERRPAPARPAPQGPGAPVYIVNRPGTDYAVMLAGVLVPPGLPAGGMGGDMLVELLDSRVSRLLRDESAISHETFAGSLKSERGDIIYFYADARAERVQDALQVLGQALRPAPDPASFCAGAFKQAQTAAARRGLRALESSQSLMNYLTSAPTGAGPGGPQRAPGCEQILDLSGRLFDDPRVVVLLLGDAERLAEQARRGGYRTRILQRPCWASLY